MSDTTSANNGWVESYLDALLSEGLSSEYIKRSDREGDEKAAKFNADRQIYSKYYVHQVLQQGEESLRDAWTKATNARHYEEKDARLEYLSWRVWFMKRNRARVKREDAATLAAEQVDLPPITEEEKGEVEDPDRDDETDSPKAHTPEAMGAAAVARRPSMALPPVPQRAKPPSGKPPKAAGADDSGPRPIRTHQSDQVSENLRELSLADDVSPSAVEAVGADVFDGRVDGLYIILISLHGLVRGDKMELGKDADTGGQVKYVVELARALGQHPAVYRVDLLTRLIKDPKVDKTYGVEEECILQATGAENELGGAYIVRLSAGPEEQYLRKEKLWPHVREFADRGIAHAKRMLTKLAEQKTPCELYVVHGHYADAGEVAALMSATLSVDMCMTGHSLGRNKLEHLLASGTVSRAEIEHTYKINRRVEAEERALDSAIMVFTSTEQEIDEQWGLYDGYDSKLENVLRYRRRTGRHMPFMNVIPPGLDFSSLKVDLPEDPAVKEMLSHKPAYGAVTTPKADANGKDDPFNSSGLSGSPTSFETISPNSLEVHSPFYLHAHRVSFDERKPPSRGASLSKIGSGIPSQKQLSIPKPGVHHHMSGVSILGNAQEEPPIWKEIARFLRNPRKPAILAMSRPDAKKNITTLVKAFGENSTLRELANLVLIMGNRDNIDSMAGGSQKVLNQVLKLIDMHDLYGSVAYPKKHQQKDISDIYRLPLATRGCFTNVALQEPFGLTVIEAAAHGVPTVATKNGGPVDIMATLHHGILVDPTSSTDVADGLVKCLDLGGKGTWDEFSRNGVKNIMAYSWPSHCKKVLESLESEKRFLQQHKMHKTRLSGSWDASTGGGSTMERMGSTPFPSKDKPLTHRVSRDREAFWKAAESGGGSPKGGVGTPRAPEAAQQPNGFGRSQLVVVPLEGGFRAQETSKLLKQLAQVAGSSNGAIGVGIVSMLGFDDTKKALQETDVSLDSLDAIVCHAGADIWLSTGKEWASDDDWEHLIDFRWDRVSLQRLLTKLVTAPALLTPATSTNIKGLAPLTRALSNMPDPEKQEMGVHPHHVCVQLDREAKEILGHGRGKGAAVSTAIVDRLRRRLRSNGYRAHLTLQMVPSKDELLSNVHITPVRASRALSLRYLANRFGLDMAGVAVVVLPPVVAQRGDNFSVGSYVSDLAELVSGWCHVFIQTPKENTMIDLRQLDTADAQSIDKLTVKIGPKLFGKRVEFIEEGEALSKAVQQLADGQKAKHQS